MKEKENIFIRFGELDDVKALAEFNKAMAKETEGIELDFQTIVSGIKNLMLQKELGFYLVAESDSKPVGSLMVTYEWTDWRDGLFWWIQSVYVIPEYRNKGIYKALYEFVKNLAAKDSRVRGFRLYVDKDNYRAIEVYKKMGMIESNYVFFEEIK